MYIYNAVLSDDLVGFFLNGFITYKPMLVVEWTSSICKHWFKYQEYGFNDKIVSLIQYDMCSLSCKPI